MRGDGEGGDIFLVALDDPLRFRAASGEVVEVAGEVEAYDEIIGSTGGPDDADLVVGNTDDAFLAHAPGLCAFPGFGIPDLHGLVSTGCDEALGVAGPGDAEDAAFVLVCSDLGSHFASFAVVKPDFSVSTDADQGGAVGAEGDAVDEAVVLGAERGVEFEGGAVVEDEGGIVAAGCRSSVAGMSVSCPRTSSGFRYVQWSLLPYGNTVDLRAMPRYLSHGIPTIGRYAMPKSLLTVSHSNNPLTVPIPS